MSEFTEGLRKIADFLDQAPDHTFTNLSSLNCFGVFVQNEADLATVQPLLDQLTPEFKDAFTTFTLRAGPVGLVLNVKTDLIAEKAEVGTTPVYGYQLKPSAA